MKIIFAGTPEFAANALGAILAAGHHVALVLTQPDRPAGRGMQQQPGAVKKLAVQHNIAVFQPERLKEPITHEPLRNVQADVMVVAAYGLILPQAVLDIPHHGCLNIHASLLPRWRGAAPIQRAIEAGDTESGITIMQMEAGLDSGPILLRQGIPIATTDTAASLHDKLAALGATLIVKALSRLDQLRPEMQSTTGITYAHKIEKSEAVVSWQDGADTLSRKIRAFNPFPGMTATLRGTPIKLWHATPVGGDGNPGCVLHADGDGVIVITAKGAVCVTSLQKSGGKRLSARDFLTGFPIAAGEIFA